MSSAGLARSGVRRPLPSAFTLIELLVVVAIIALLISILLPSLTAAREQGRATVCLSNLKSIGNGAWLYVDDQRGYLPGPLHPPIYRTTGQKDNPDFPPMNPDTERWQFLLARITRQMVNEDEQLRYIDRIATCPTAKMRNPDINFKPGATGIYQATAKNPSWSRPYNYLPNTWSNTSPKFYFGWTNIGVTWAGWANFYLKDPEKSAYQPPQQLEKIRAASAEWAIGDAWWDFKRVMTLPGQFRDTPLGTWQLSGNPPGSSDNSSNNPLPKKPYHRREKGTQLIFFDGHASVFTGIDDEWALKFPGNRPPPEPQ